MDEDNEKYFEFDSEMNYAGVVKINLLRFIENLSDEQKQILLDDGGWWPFVEERLVKSIIEEFGSENYNSQYHRFRSLILNNEAMPEIIRMWAKEMIGEKEYSNTQASYWKQAYQELEKWVADTGVWKLVRGREDKPFIDVIPRLPKRSYYKEYPEGMVNAAYKLADEWAKLFPDRPE